MSTPINELPEEPLQDVEDDNMIHEIMASLNSTDGDSERTPEHTKEKPIEAARSAHSYDPEDVLQEPRKVRVPSHSRSLLSTIWREAKWPFLVLTLFIVFSLQIVDRNLLKIIPKLARESGNLGVLGLIIKGLLLSISFFILTKII